MCDGSMIFNRSDPCGGRILSLLSGGGLLGYGFTPSDPVFNFSDLFILCVSRVSNPRRCCKSVWRNLMFRLWHWAGIQGVIRNYYRLMHSSDYASMALATLADTLGQNGLESTVKDYSINIAKRMRGLGCDKASAYVVGASVYASEAFKLDPERCKFVTLFIQDSLDNEELIHPLAVVAVQKAKDEMLSVL